MSEQLAGMDSAFLSMETPESPMHVVGVLILDPAGGNGYSNGVLRRVLEDRLHLIPPFGRRLVDVPLALDKPYWHYEPDINLTQHVYDATLPAPGGLHELAEFVGNVAEQLLPRDRPLWQVHIVDGLEGGKSALVAKVHHSTIYGVAGAEFIGELLDLTPEITPKDAPEAVERMAPPGLVTLARRTVVSTAKMPVTAGAMLARGSRGAVSTGRAVVDAVRRHGREVLPGLAPRIPISGAPTARRSVAFTALPIEDVKRLKNAAGVTLNDAVLATVGLAVRKYLAERDALPDRPLAVGVPMNAGEGQTAGTNSLALMQVSMPIDIDEPRAMLKATHAATVAAKEFTQALGPNAISELANLTMPAAISMMTWLTRTLGLAAAQPPLANLVVSNVMGPPIPLYLAGAQVDAIFPMGPLMAGAGMNVTVLSNLDRLDVGIMACPDLVDDVWEIADSLKDCLAELSAIA